MKIRLSFSGAQKLLAILSFLLAAGYFVYLAMAWSGLEERIVIYWRVPLSMHIEIAYRWYLLLPPIAGVFGISSLVMIAVCVPLSDLLSIVVTAVFVAREVRKLRRMRVAESSQAQAAASADGETAAVPTA